MARTLAAGGVHGARRRAERLRLRPVHRRPGAALRRARSIGATVIPISGGNTKRQIMIMQDFGTTVLCCTPSYALYIAEAAREMGVDLRELPLRVGFFGAEPWIGAACARRSRSRLGVDALDIYGLSEIIGPGRRLRVPATRTACTSTRTTSTPRSSTPTPASRCPPGERGELVFTTPHQGGAAAAPLPHARHHRPRRGALPLRPHRCAAWTTSPAAPTTCSSSAASTSSPRRSRACSLGIEGVEPHYLLVVDRETAGWTSWRCGWRCRRRCFSDEMKRLEALEQQVRAEIESVLGLHVRGEAGGAEDHRAQRGQGQARDGQKGPGPMKVSQISVFLENKSGRLAEVTRALADRDQHPRALHRGDDGLRRAAADRERPGRRPSGCCSEGGFTVTETDVLVLEIPDRARGAGARRSSGSPSRASTSSTSTRS